MEGYGECYWKDQDKKYYGYHKQDKKHGFGIYYWEKTFKIYVGFFKNGKQEGMGKMITKDRVKWAYWKDGQNIKPFNNAEEALASLAKKDLKYKHYFTLDINKLIHFLS
jgi:hypothetical protein